MVTQPISDVEVKENGLVTLRCEFCPSPRVVHWFKGRTPLLASSKYTMRQEKNHVEMTIMGVKAADAGEYWCLAGGAESRGRVNVEGMDPNVFKGHLFPKPLCCLKVLQKLYGVKKILLCWGS